jgi:hypothetical protein
MKAQKFHHESTKAEAANNRRGSSLLFIFVILVSCLLSMDPSDLPDYEAYERIYQNALLGEDWEIFFVFINFLFLQSGYSYSAFRDFVLVFSTISLWITFARLQPAKLEKSALLRTTNIFLMFFVLAVFLFEYSTIRIRAGFAIGIIWFALYLMLSSRTLLGWIFAFISLVLAFFTHKSTTLILIVFLGLPFIATIWKGRPRLKKRLFILVSVGSVALLLYMMNSSYELRGEHIYSPLNPVRFVMLSIIPLLMFLFTKNESMRIVMSGSSMKDFPNYFVRLYVVLAIALSLLFFAGLTGDSGEALVRLYTLSSVPALLSLRLSGSALMAPISAYILIINALFFLVTVFLPGGQGGI